MERSYTRKLRRSLPSKVLINFSFSLAMVLVIFLVGMDRTEVQIICQVVSGFLQFFMLSTFIWMAVYAVSLYQAIVLVFKGGSDSKFFLFSNILAWGIPAIIVIATGSASDELINDKYCFVSGYPFYFGVLLPVATIIIINTSLLIAMMVSLRRKPPVSSTKKQQNQTLEQMRIAISCGVLLGLTWVFGLLAVGSDAASIFTFQLLFCIFNSLQGAFVFVLYTIRNPTVKKFLLNRCHGIDTSNLSSSNPMQRSKKTKRTLDVIRRKRMGGKATESESSSSFSRI